MCPQGANLTLEQLLAALKWKLENETDGSSPFDVADFSNTQRINWASTWSERILESTQITSLLKHRMNALPPVNHLPFEIIGAVFLFLQNEYRNTSFQVLPEKFDAGRANSWIKLTHVCRHWRRSAHNTKALWCRITLGNKMKSPAHLATSFFALSRPLPITLEHELGSLSRSEEQQMNRFYRVLIQQPDRISALYLRGHLPNDAWNLLQFPLPNIVEVELSFEKVLTLVEYSNSTADELLPIKDGRIQNFLGGHPSSLQKLSLENFTWPRQSFHALTHLHLTEEFYEDPLEDDEFFQVLGSLSSTLQFLSLRSAGPMVLDPEVYVIRPMAERLIMPVLTHLEIYPERKFLDTNCLLLHLYNLCMPQIETIVWDSRWTEGLDQFNPATLWGMSMVPPPEQLAQVTSFIGCGGRTTCYVLSGKMLYFNPDMGFSVLESWATLLPNVVTLALPLADYSCYEDDVRDALKEYTALKSLHFCYYDDLIPFLLDLEESQESWNAEFLPHLRTLTIYTGRCDFKEQYERTKASKKLVKHGLDGLKLSVGSSMTRVRRHLQTTYTLQFERGGINGLTFDQARLLA